MPTPDDWNARIALCKGWTWTGKLAPLPEQCNYYSEWLDPTGRVDFLPHYVDSLAGCAELLWELNERAAKRGEWWDWSYCTDMWPIRDFNTGYRCAKKTSTVLAPLFLPVFLSPDDRPGDCIGEAWMSVHGKEAADASTE